MQTRKEKWKADARDIDAEDLSYLSYQCAIEEIISLRRVKGVMGKSDWHDLCNDPDDCECPEHGSE